jgi:hypothetical protein
MLRFFYLKFVGLLFKLDIFSVGIDTYDCSEMF